MPHQFSQDFGPFDGTIWLNCAHQGPLPRIAASAAYEAIRWKIAPHHIATLERFDEVPQRLKHLLGQLVSASPDNIILGNSASYGLHLLANGIPWQAGDEIVLMQGDFPSDIFPWLALKQQGVRIRLIKPHHHVLQVDELAANLTPSTRLFCTTWVHSFSGYTVDVRALGEVCRRNGITFVLNCSQALGTLPLDVSTAPIDALVCVGFKWLCGPYGTGFCWMRPELLKSLNYNQAYWLTMQAENALAKPQNEIALPTERGAETYDVFGTANFFNFCSWIAAIEYLLGVGIEQINVHNDNLVSRLIDGLDQDKYDLLSPYTGDSRSTLVFISHKQPDRNGAIHETLQREGIYTSLRMGSIRFSPHLYNTPEDIDRALSVLHAT